MVFENLDLGKKIGPLPLYGWLMAAGGTGLVLYKLGFGKSLSGKGGSPSGPGQGDQFQSSRSTTSTDASGNQVQTTYSATGDGYLPGFLSVGASPMPTSGGDVYVNYPTPNNTPTPPPPPENKTPVKPYTTVNMPPNSQGVTDNNANGLATIVYGLINPDEKDAIMGASQIVSANPQIDWARPLPPGTTVNIPLRWIYQGFKNKDTAYNKGD